MKSKLKVGDELAFEISNFDDGRHWEIHEITSISKTGRLTCGYWILNPNLTVRGTRHYGVREAVEVTDEIRRAAKRKTKLTYLKYVRWNNLTDDQLDRVCKITKEGSHE